jgi:hypothetical protein
MKGQYSYLLGLLVVIIGMVIFFVDMTFKTGDQINIVSGSVEVWSSMHGAEKLKRAIQAASMVDAEMVVQDIALKGGGTPVWEPGEPKDAPLVGALESGMRSQLRKVDINGLEGRLIEWSVPEVKIDDLSDTGFHYSGQMPFSVTSKLANPEVQLTVQGAFEGTVSTSYFKLVSEGRELAYNCNSITLGETKLGTHISQVFNASIGEQLLYDVNITDPAEPLKLSFTLNCTVPAAS